MTRINHKNTAENRDRICKRLTSLTRELSAIVVDDDTNLGDMEALCMAKHDIESAISIIAAIGAEF